MAENQLTINREALELATKAFEQSVQEIKATKTLSSTFIQSVGQGESACQNLSTIVSSTGETLLALSTAAKGYVDFALNSFEETDKKKASSFTATASKKATS